MQKRSRVAVVGEGDEELYWPRQLELASYVQPYTNFVSRAAQALIGIGHWVAASDRALGIQRWELATLAGILHTSLVGLSPLLNGWDLRPLVLPVDK